MLTPGLTPGTILAESGTLLPPSMRHERSPDPAAWMPVTSSLGPQELESALTAGGWTFFFMAGTVRATAFGFDREKSMQTALRRVIAGVKLQKCNSLEIDEVGVHTWLGIPYVSVTAHSRHFQKGSVFRAR